MEVAGLAGSLLNKFCAHCGAQGEPRLGFCSECGGPVCSRCGNTQHVMGEHKVMHDTCLKHGEGSSFSMIKFVK
ncbi:MAG: hypothetical protein FD171_1482 [Actinobacteria bacterium]|nr:MAG: hypothetical protein FD171_1482 [Actinomycetota bacterium]MDO8949081.1 hypothetical protein [Actinomycetota bacterium]